MKINRAIKYRAYPTDEQWNLFYQTCGCVRKYWNQALNDSMEFLSATGKAFVPTPAKYKREFPFLKEIDSMALCNAQLDLKAAWKKCFTEKGIGIPKYKSRKHNNVTSYTTNLINGNIKFVDKYLQLPKMGKLRIMKHRSPQNGWFLKSVTVCMKAGKMYVSVLFEIQEQIPAHVVVTDESEVLGLDYSMPKLYVDSNGSEPDYGHPYYVSQKKLSKEQRKLSHMQKGSHNFEQQKIKVSCLHQRISNQRLDFCHRCSTQIANEYIAVGVEDLNLRGMAGALQFGKRINDNGFGLFRNMLRYKLEARGNHYIVVDKWLPSTQTCSFCGYVLVATEKLTLSERSWQCPCCGTNHERDINAAVNIRNAVFRILTA